MPQLLLVTYLLSWYIHMDNIETNYILTADAWVSVPDLAPQKILLSQQFRHMRCLNCWDNKKFWGAKSDQLTHASAVKYVNMYIQLGT